MSYGLSFASISATIVHAILYFRKPIYLHLHRSLKEQPDIHAQLMARYRQGTFCYRSPNMYYPNCSGSSSGMVVRTM